MPNVKEQLTNIHFDFIDIRVKVDELCTDYEEIIKDLHTSMVFKDNEIKELKEKLDNSSYLGDY